MGSHGLIAPHKAEKQSSDKPSRSGWACEKAPSVHLLNVTHGGREADNQFPQAPTIAYWADVSGRASKQSEARGYKSINCVKNLTLGVPLCFSPPLKIQLWTLPGTSCWHFALSNTAQHQSTQLKPRELTRPWPGHGRGDGRCGGHQ